MTAKTAWRRSLGTSKKEQGITTPKAPQNDPKYWLRKAGKITPRPVLLQPKVTTKLTLWQKVIRWVKGINKGRARKK